MKKLIFYIIILVFSRSYNSFGNEVFPENKNYTTNNYFFVLYKSYNKNLLESGNKSETASLILEHYKSIRSDLNNDSMLFHTLEINVFYLLLQYLPKGDLNDFSVVNNIDSVIKNIIQNSKETECFNDSSFRNNVFVPFEMKLLEIYKEKNLSKKVELLSSFAVSSYKYPFECIYYVEIWNSFCSSLLDLTAESD